MKRESLRGIPPNIQDPHVKQTGVFAPAGGQLLPFINEHGFQPSESPLHQQVLKLLLLFPLMEQAGVAARLLLLIAAIGAAQREAVRRCP